jgi:hypothetical protein
MPFQVSCAHCGNRLNVKDEWEGKRIKCPRCGDMFPAARPAAAPLRSRVRELADEEIAESAYSLPFRFGPDDVHPRLLYWGFMLYLLLDAIIAVPILVRLGRDPSNQCLECLIGRASAIVVPLAIGVCIFVAYSMAALMYAGWKLLFVGVVTAGAFGAHMDGQPVDVSPIVLLAIWHVVGLILGIWYFMVRRE